MTIAFMALVCSQIVDRISILLLSPMLLTGMATVLYWRTSELVGGGNAVPYAILQGYSVIVVLMLVALSPAKRRRCSATLTT